MSRRPALFAGLVFQAALLFAAPSLACPGCPTARATRAAVLGEGFWLHLGLTLMPLLVLAVICLRLYRIGLEKPASAPASAATTRATES